MNGVNSFGVTEGKTQLHVSVHVNAAEMKNWEPDRIMKFWEGIAQMVRCVRAHHFEDTELGARWAKVKKAEK